MGIAFTNAINRYTEHRCRLITSQERYGIDFGKDIHLPDIVDDDFGEVEQLLKNADIIHFHMLTDENAHLGPLVIRDYIKGKRIIHHHHGHPEFRADPAKFRHKYKALARLTLVSTPDLLRKLPEAIWLPNVVPLDNPLLQPKIDLPQDRIIIGQSPTRKDLKNTDSLFSVYSKLSRIPNMPKLELRIIEMIHHDQCLFKKNTCHIAFDHMQGYYGVASLESLAQAKPVIAGLDDWNLQCIRAFTGTEEIPWQIARNEEELYDVLHKLVMDEGLRRHIGKQSRNFMEKHWTEQQALSILMDAYQQLN